MKLLPLFPSRTWRTFSSVFLPASVSEFGVTESNDLIGDLLLSALEYVQDQSGDDLEYVQDQSGDALEYVQEQPGDDLEYVQDQSGDAIHQNSAKLVNSYVNRGDVCLTEYWPSSNEPVCSRSPTDTAQTLRSVEVVLEPDEQSPSPSPSPSPSTAGRRKRGWRDSVSPPPAKRKTVTTWRKGQDDEIEKNEEILRALKAASEMKEMIVMSKEAVLAGLQGLKTYDFTHKMKTFAELKTDQGITEAKKEMEGKKVRCQQKAKYQRLQQEQVSRYQKYNAHLDHLIRNVTTNIENSSNVYYLY